MTPVTMAALLPPDYQYDPDDPSKYRRRALMAEGSEDGSIGVAVSSFFPITRYYDASEKVLSAFDEAHSQRKWDDAFVYGKRYCTFVIESIPKHNYYLSTKFAKQKSQSLKNVDATLRMLESIVSIMNEEEKNKHKKRVELAKIEAERREKERKRQEEIQKQREAAKYQELMRRAELQKKSSTSPTSQPSSNGDNVEQSAMSKLQMLMKQSSTSSVSNPPAPAASAPPPPQSTARPSGRYFLSDTDEDDDELNPPSSKNGGRVEVGKPLPPPLPPPGSNGIHSNGGPTSSLPPPISPPAAAEAPPSYDFATNTNRRNPFLGRSDAPFALPPPASAWENSRPGPPSYNSLPDPPSKRYPSQSSSSNHSSQNHHAPAPAAKKKKKIPVRQMRDRARRRYSELMSEGRIEVRPIDTYQGRYNASTNGCTVISPLVVAHHLAQSPGVLLPDREIKQVIDNECGPLLREIRGKLGLESGSLIIPSDVHDHLVDNNILKQDEFVGATGGNIVSDEHMGEFIKLFQERLKAGAALFFREHVVSIVKQPVGNGQAYYDLVDSMPGTKDSRNNPCATRTRCKDKEALDVLLTWYATKKFSESNCSYIDNNEWNDNMADLDPRVFQAFVWGKDG